MSELPDHVVRNRASWDRLATKYLAPGRVQWAQPEPSWGIWGVPEARLRVLPDEVRGFDVIELGCGTGYVSAWLARKRRSGFVVEDLIEVRPDEGAVTRYPFVTLEWSRRWPCEEIWKARRVGGGWRQQEDPIRRSRAVPSSAVDMTSA